MEVINKIKIDLLRAGVKPMINAMQADENSRVIEITLNANGSAWEIPDGVSFSVAYKKPDGTRGLYDTMPDGTSASSVDGNVVSIRLAPQMLTAPGTVTASVVISSGDQRISTFPIIVNVIQNPAVGAVGSEDYFYSSVIGNLDDLKTTDKTSLVAAINEIFSTGGNGGTGNGSNSGQNPTVATVEPAHEDRPKFFFGAPLQQTKDEIVTTFSYRSKTLSFDCYAEIKAQGNSTLMWPKKNQAVKLYKDAACTEKFKINFKGWGKQNKFVLKAYWRDLTHVRDIVSVRLEGDCMRTNPDYDGFPELLRTSPDLGGVDGFPVVVYAAGVYQGRYMLNIPKDKWAYNMDDDLDEHCVLCSEDYNSSCFRAAANINGNDWTDEIHDTVPASIKNRWNEVISFVMNSTDEEFAANLDSYIKVSTLIDRHIMGLLSCDYDGYGKNQLYITYDGEQFYANRYDKDGTWGVYWTGNSMLPSSYGREQYEDMISGRPGNLLFIRLEQLFSKRLQTRWAELKVGPLSIPNIINRFRELYDITPLYVIEEDYASTTANGAFTGIPNKTTCTIQQIQTFVVERHAWMDEYIAGLTPEIPVPCTGISLDKSTLTFTAEGKQTLTATVTPDGCTDPITWESDNTSVATVNGGVVTAIANGSATITAKCGEYSASCTLSVSGIAEIVPCTGITLDKTELTFDGEGAQTITATVTPADTTDSIIWNSNNEAVAIVGDGVVIAVGNGSATITATCGEYSASCAVSVSGFIAGDEIHPQLGEVVSIPTPIRGYIDMSSGNVANAETDSCSDKYIKIPEGADYYNHSTTLGYCDVFYDADRTRLSYNRSLKAAYNGVVVGLIPNGACYVRVSVNDIMDKIDLAFGEFEQLAWETGKIADSSDGTVTPGTGSDFITFDNAIPAGATKLIVDNIGGSTYTFKTIFIYDSENACLLRQQNVGTAQTAAELLELSDPHHFAVKAFPAGNSANNDPANQIGVYHNGLLAAK